ncbi:MAG: glutamyl-tRNA reductase [Bacteroidota bacterium]
MYSGEGKQFNAIGISYQQADLGLREKFSLSAQQIDQLLTTSQALPLYGILPISTCNRTELYAWSPSPEVLQQLLLDHCDASKKDWHKVGWVRTGQAAMTHLFRVGCGLESNILGDFQIIGQIRRAYEVSKTRKTSHSYLERLINTTIRISKRVKGETNLSKGSASISFAASSFIKIWLNGEESKKILLLGAGEIGKATCSNLLKHIHPSQLTLINRSHAKAEELSLKYQTNIKPWEELHAQVQASDVIIVATGAQQAILTADMVNPDKKQLLLDLSMPRNIETEIGDLSGKTLLDLDQLVLQTREVVANRQQDIPLAEKIIETEGADFFYWLETRRFAPILKGIKEELLEIHRQELKAYSKKHPEADERQLADISQLLIHKTTGHLAKFFHQQASEK